MQEDPHDIVKIEADEIGKDDFASRDVQFQKLLKLMTGNLELLVSFTVENSPHLITVSVTCHPLLQLWQLQAYERVEYDCGY